jgi:hypothetical protein
MKLLIALCVCGLSVALPAQTSLRAFNSPDGVFQFAYSDMLVDCTKKVPSKPTSSGLPRVFVGTPPALSIPDSCQSMEDVCSDLGGQVSTLACFAYPKDKFRDKPVFAAAAFFVGKIEEATTESDCLQGSQNWNPDERETAKLTKINGVAFKVFEIGDNWAGGGQGGPVYRTFRDTKCYELGIQTSVERAAYDPETSKEFTKQDSDEVQRRMKQALNSFKFVK